MVNFPFLHTVKLLKLSVWIHNISTQHKIGSLQNWPITKSGHQHELHVYEHIYVQMQHQKEINPLLSASCPTWKGRQLKVMHLSKLDYPWTWSFSTNDLTVICRDIEGLERPDFTLTYREAWDLVEDFKIIN